MQEAAQEPRPPGEETPKEAEEPSAVAPAPTAQVVLQGQRMDIRKPAADYLAELVDEARALRLSPLDIVEIESMSLQGEAAILDQLEFEASLGGPQVQVDAMEPRRRNWIRRREAALILARKAGWP